MAANGVSTRFTFTIQGLSAAVRVARFEAREAISEPFQVELMLTSDDKDIAFADVVGKPAVLKIETEGSEPRFFHGIVSRFRHDDDGPLQSGYAATLVPALFRLGLRHDSRIFQSMTVPAIIDKVLTGAGIAKHRTVLTGSYAPREYCVQYRESDLAFISRLMEEEGIFYFFEHTEDDDLVVLGDAPGAPQPIKGSDTLPYKGEIGAMVHADAVWRFSSYEEVRPGKVTLTDYNFKKPSLSLLSSTSGKLDTDLEVYDYPGEYELPTEGSSLSKVRLEEQQARRAVGEGESSCFRMTPGYLFSLSDHPRDAENRKYLITAVLHRGGHGLLQPAEGGAPASGSGHKEGYTNTIRVIASDVPFRPERRTPRPTIKGVQTAIVTGPGGEEVHVDEHGRVKVHFHWDRKGKNDDSSSCWIRVSQLWAGAGWGAMWIPRVGHEVIVDFIEGDPDRPIIVGRVYHGANVPPYPLPAEKTKSTIKSDSSKGGGGFNELRFEDKKGSEEVYLQGEKDWKILIKNDKSQKIGHDETLDVGHNQAIHIGDDRTKTVDANQSETIGANKNIKVGGNHTESIDGNESITVGGSSRVQIGVTRSVTVAAAHDEKIGLAQVSTIGGAWSKNVGAAASINVVGSKTETVGLTSGESVGGNKSTEVGGNYVIDVKKDFNTTVVDNMGLKVKKDLKEDVEKNLTIVVGESISVKCGEVQIEIKKDGSVKVEGKDITVTGKGPIKVKGKELDVTSDGAVNVKASGAVKVEGSKVDIN